jgi:Fic family protein
MYSFTYTSEIVNKISQISSLQGQLHSSQLDVQTHHELMFSANVDAVHFSTKIEGNPLTLKQVTEALKKSKIAKPDRSLKEIINYSRARAFLMQSPQKSLSHEIINTVHDLLLNQIVIKSHRGRYRTGQNVIKDLNSRAIVYMPPDPQDVSSLMDQLIKEVKKIALTENGLIAAAYFHFGFATIHPYMDGNGRLARLGSSFLLHQGSYTLNQFAALEKQHEKNRSAYYRALHLLQGNNFYDIPSKLNITSWLDYFLKCTLDAYTEAIERIGQLPVKSNELEDRLALALSLFKKFKKLKTSDYESLVHVARTQAVHDINQLIDKGFIEKVGGGRSTVYRLKMANRSK